jgi:hypothetical protein
MANSKKIKITTSSVIDTKTNTGVTKSINLQTPASDEPLIKDVLLVDDQVGKLNSIDFKEGELLMVSENNPDELSVWIDSNGELNIKAVDSDNYSINELGELIYEKVI